MIAEVAAGNATAGEEKWEVAKTTPKAEFCIPTCKASIETLTSSVAYISRHREELSSCLRLEATTNSR